MMVLDTAKGSEIGDHFGESVKKYAHHQPDASLHYKTKTKTKTRQMVM